MRRAEPSIDAGIFRSADLLGLGVAYGEPQAAA